MAKDTNVKKNQDKQLEEKSKFSVEQIKEFSADVKSEFSKIAWPDKKHTIGSTAVVVVLVMLVSVYLGTVDLVLGKLIGTVLK